MLITHAQNIGAATGISLHEGETAIFRPDGRGGSKLIARVHADGWKALGRTVTAG